MTMLIDDKLNVSYVANHNEFYNKVLLINQTVCRSNYINLLKQAFGTINYEVNQRWQLPLCQRGGARGSAEQRSRPHAPAPWSAARPRTPAQRGPRTREHREDLDHTHRLLITL